jgi:Uma2 family endonuclease
MSVMVSI